MERSAEGIKIFELILKYNEILSVEEKKYSKVIRSLSLHDLLQEAYFLHETFTHIRYQEEEFDIDGIAVICGENLITKGMQLHEVFTWANFIQKQQIEEMLQHLFKNTMYICFSPEAGKVRKVLSSLDRLIEHMNSGLLAINNYLDLKAQLTNETAINDLNESFDKAKHCRTLEVGNILSAITGYKKEYFGARIGQTFFNCPVILEGLKNNLIRAKDFMFDGEANPERVELVRHFIADFLIGIFGLKEQNIGGRF